LKGTSQSTDTVTRNAPAGYLYWWLLLALFVEYARPASFVPALQVPYLYSAIPLLLFIATLFAKGLLPLSTILSDGGAKWVFAFLALVTVSVITAEVTTYAFEVFKLVFGYVIIFILIARIATTEDRLGGVFAVLLVAHLFLLVMNPAVVLDPGGRHYITGANFLGDGNDFALSLCILFPLTLYLAKSSRKRVWKLLLWVCAAVIVAAIIGSQSRGAALGMGVVLIYLWLQSPRKLGAIAVAAVVGVGALVYAPPVYFSRMSTIQHYQDDGSAQGERLLAQDAGRREVVGAQAHHHARSGREEDALDPHRGEGAGRPNALPLAPGR